MKTLTDSQTAALYCPAGYASRCRVKVEDVGGTWHNLASLGGYNWQTSVSWSESVDARTGSVAVDLVREVADFSLAPLVTDSALYNVDGSGKELLARGRTIVVEGAVFPAGEEPQEADYVERFRGRIDEVDAGGQGVRILARDLGGLLADTLIEEEREYGSTAGTPVQTVMQSILNDNGLSSVTLTVAGSPSWNLGPYKQTRETVLDALTKLADQMGWSVWYKSSGASLVLGEPDRTGATVAWTFDRGAYRDLSSCRTHGRDYRTRVLVTFADTADRDAKGEPIRKTATAEDAALIAADGGIPRTMAITEGASSNINTLAEAQRMADAALADLKHATLEVEVEVGFHPGLEVGDMVTLTGPSRSFTADQTIAVVALTHSFDERGGRTRLTLRGKPSLSKRRWQQMDARVPILAPTNLGPFAPSLKGTTPILNGVSVEVEPPTSGPAVAEYEWHVSTTSGFTPDASNPSSTLKEVSRSSRYEATNLSPGVTYYVKAVPRDAKGNRGTVSPEATVVSRHVAPVDLQPQVIYSSLTPNPSFEAWTNGAGSPPDAWEVSTGTWGTDFSRTTTSLSGGYAISVIAPTSGERLIRSQYISVTEGQIYAATLRYYQPTGTGLSGASLQLRWYTSAFVELGASAALMEGTATGSWQTLTAHKTAPSTARYARLLVGHNGITSSDPVYLDMAQVDVYAPIQETPGAVAAFEPAFSSSSASPARVYTTSTGEVQFQGAIESSTTVSGGTVRAFYTSLAPAVPRAFRVATSSGSTNVTVAPDGYVSVLSPTAGVSIYLDQVRYRR